MGRIWGIWTTLSVFNILCQIALAALGAPAEDYLNGFIAIEIIISVLCFCAALKKYKMASF